MANIRKINVDDINSHSFTMNAIKEYFDVEGIEGYYLMCDDDFIYIEEGYIVIFHELEDKVDIRSFEFDEDFKIIQCDLGEHTTYTKMAKTEQFLDNRTNIVETIQYGKRSNDLVDEDGYNGIVSYSQYDQSRDRSISMTYQQIFNGDNLQLYPAIFMKKPRFVEFDKHCGLKHLFHIPIKGKRYAKMDTSYDCSHYTYITMNEYGIIKTLQEGAYALQKEKYITRYFKEIATIQNIVFTTCPFGTPYTIDDVHNSIKEWGMKIEPDKELIDFMNGKYPEDYKRYLDIIDTMIKMQEEDKMPEGIRFEFRKEEDKRLVMK